MIGIFFISYNFYLINNLTLAQVHAKAYESFNKDQSFRYWGAMHGGVYVPVTQETPPNQYLTNVKERDLTTPQGTKLTLMNPAYMIRQLNESFRTLYEVQGHITSLNPLRPENGPDQWEAAALHAFEKGVHEIYEVVQEGDASYARLMRPMLVTAQCLKCHEHQGYKIHDIRGGVSVKVPMAPFLAAKNSLMLRSGSIFILLWTFGVILSLFVSRLLAGNLRALELMAQTLERAKATAEAANSAKSVFLANMSHEIRTPLNGITSMLQLFRTTPMDEEQKEYAKAAIESSERLTRLLSDILDISMAETGVITLRHEPFSLEEVCKLTHKLFQASMDKTKINLEFTCGPGLPESVLGDSVRLQQILINLVGNAIKFTESGRILAEISALSPLSAGTCRILFSISDTGCGIADEKLESLFEPFSQMDEGYNRSYQGAGLGLSICKRLVELMGGSLVVCSVTGQGTTVHFSLIFTLSQKAQPSVETFAGKTPLPSLNLRILLAEDDRVSRLAEKRLLSKLGCEVTAVEDGKRALATLNDSSFDLVILDIQMPEMDGLELTQAIRDGKAGAAKKDLPIIAMTAYAMGGDEERFVKAGVTGYIAKPLDMEDFLNVLRKVLSDRE